MNVLNRDAILASSDMPREAVEVPEWGGFVFVRGLTAGERFKYESAAHQHLKKHGTVPATYQAQLVVLGTVDDRGAPVFTEADTPALMDKSGAVIQRLAKRISELSGMSADESREIRGN